MKKEDAFWGAGKTLCCFYSIYGFSYLCGRYIPQEMIIFANTEYLNRKSICHAKKQTSWNIPSL